MNPPPPSQLVFDPVLPAPVLAVLGAVLLLLTVRIYWTVGRSAGRRRNLALLVFRLAGVALVLALLLQPSRREFLSWGGKVAAGSAEFQTAPRIATPSKPRARQMCTPCAVTPPRAKALVTLSAWVRATRTVRNSSSTCAGTGPWPGLLSDGKTGPKRIES